MALRSSLYNYFDCKHYEKNKKEFQNSNVDIRKIKIDHFILEFSTKEIQNLCIWSQAIYLLNLLETITKGYTSLGKGRDKRLDLSPL